MELREGSVPYTEETNVSASLEMGKSSATGNLHPYPSPEVGCFPVGLRVVLKLSRERQPSPGQVCHVIAEHSSLAKDGQSKKRKAGKNWKQR